MSSNDSDSPRYGKAEARFREAFARLRMGSPLVVPKGTPVTQNNIAKEAGKNPTALRKERFPNLVREIQTYVEEGGHGEKATTAKQLAAARAKNRELRERLDNLTAERDLLLSELESLRAYAVKQAIARERAVDGVNQDGVVQAEARFLRSGKASVD